MIRKVVIVDLTLAALGTVAFWISGIVSIPPVLRLDAKQLYITSLHGKFIILKASYEPMALRIMVF